MSRLLFTTALTLLLFSCKKPANQAPIENNKALKWSKTFGGSGYDMANSVIQLTSGDYIVAGNTRSNDGDISGSRIGYDAWLLKMDVKGNKVWSMTYGANDDDYANSVAPAPDGGFLIAGYTFVNNQNYSWVIKTDAYGNKQWQKNLNQSSDSKAFSIIANDDATFTVVGYTMIDALQDGMVVKIDANGNIVWSKTYGGSGEDYFTSGAKTTDGIVLVGYSKSSDGALSKNRGSYDGWILKIDQAGNKVWSTSYGGSNEDYLKAITSAGGSGFVVAGYTKSNDGDISTNHGGNEEWVFKIDGAGNKQWLKTFGGLNEEYVTSVVSTSDGSFITAGYTNSTTFDVYRPNNDFGGWLTKIDANGNKTASSTYGTDKYDDFTNALIPTQDGGYMLSGYTFVDGRGYDAWLVKIDNL